MSFQFRRGERKTTSLLIGLSGASGSGKTYTAILLALGLAYPGMTEEQILAALKAEGRSRVVVLDSEGGRALHYAPKPGQEPDFKSSFPFEYGELSGPFTPDLYKEAVVAANEAGFAAVIVDSFSHVYEGEGGILEWADRLAEGVPKPGVTNPEPWKRDQWIEQPVKSPGNWKDPKRSHKIMVGRFLQCRSHMIFCLRAEEKMQLVQEKYTDRGGQQRSTVKVIPASDRPVKERWEPICEKRFPYELTASFVLLPSEPGVGIPLKLQEQHRHCFPEGERIGRRSGECLAAWASGNAAQGGGEADKAAPGGGDRPASTDDKAAAAREKWVANFVDKLAKLDNLDALTQLQEAQRDKLDQFRDGYPELWRRITDAQGVAYDRLS